MAEQGMDVCFLSAKHPPMDKRVFDKEAVSLARAGFAVVHVAPGKKVPAKERGVEIRTYAEPSNLLDRVLQLPRLFRIASGIDAACYHCNEVDSWLVGVALKVARRKKVVFDVHEIYPEEFAESRFPPFARPAVAGAVRLAIRAMLPLTDVVVLAKESAAPDYPGSSDKQVLVRNFVSLDAAGIDRTAERPPAHGNRIRAVHIGGISRERGWPQLVAALQKPGLELVDVVLLGGFVDDDRSGFDEAVRAAGLMGRFEILPWLPFREAYRKIQECDVGLVLFQPGRLNHVHALPHKLFDYMLARLPVIVPGFAVEVARIVSEAGCGILVDTSDPEDIASALRQLSSNAKERKEFGERGRAAVLEKYNWEREARALITCYKTLLSKPGLAR